MRLGETGSMVSQTGWTYAGNTPRPRSPGNGYMCEKKATIFMVSSRIGHTSVSDLVDFLDQACSALTGGTPGMKNKYPLSRLSILEI